MTTPARKVLEAVFSLLEAGMRTGTFDLYTFMNDSVVTSIEAIGSDWPEKSYLVQWLKQLDNFPLVGFYADQVGRIVGSIGAGVNEIHEIILSFADSNEESYRALVPYSLANGWYNDETPKLLIASAVEDPSAVVRFTALRALAAYCRKDAAVLPLLHERAAEDSARSVRLAAIRILRDDYPEDGGTLPLLRSCAKNESDSLLRGVAEIFVEELEGEQKKQANE